MDLLINVDVDDLEAAIAFYQRGVGLRVGRRLFEGTVVEMLGASSPIYLMEKKAGTSASTYTSQFRDYGRHWTPVHLDFIVDDVAAAARNALAAGPKLEGELQSFSWGRQATMSDPGRRQLFLSLNSDPFGHELCFVQWLGKGYG